MLLTSAMEEKLAFSSLILVSMLFLCANPIIALDTIQIDALAKTFKLLRPVFACNNAVRTERETLIFQALQEKVLARRGLSGSSATLVIREQTFSDLLEAFSHISRGESFNLIICFDQFSEDAQEDNNEHLIKLFELYKNVAGTPSWIFETKINISSYNAIKSLAVDNKIYFLHPQSGLLTEAYSVGNSMIVNHLGMLDSDGQFTWQTSNTFLSRRSNLLGETLTAMAERQPPNLMYPARLRSGKESDWMTMPRSGDQVRDVTGYQDEFYGLFFNLLKVMEANMNFTTRFLIRRDRGWGHISNGTWTGMIRSLLHGEADFIAASLTMSILRQSTIDYLQPMQRETNGMIIKRDGLEELSYMTFFKPFRSNVWFFLFFNSVVLVMAINLIEGRYQRGILVSCLPGEVGKVLAQFWIIFASYFGGGSVWHGMNRSQALTVLLFIAFFSNHMVFMSYKASLTAELAARRDRLPFTTMEHLFESDYRLMTVTGRGGRGRGLSLFENAYEQSNFKRLYRKFIEPRLDEFKYDTVTGALEHLMTTPKRTLLITLEALYDYPEYRCDTVTAWRTRSPNFLSFGFPKRSPFREVFNYNLLRVSESGVIDIIFKRKLKDMEEVCGDRTERREPKDVALGLKKLIGPFVWLALAAAASLAFMALERIVSRKDRVLSHMEEDLSKTKLESRLSPFLWEMGSAARKDLLEEVEEYCRGRVKEMAASAEKK